MIDYITEDMSRLSKHTTSHDRAFGWETTAKELSVGQSANVSRDALIGEVALRKHLNVADIAREGNARDGGGESSQDRDEREDPHSVWLRGKELGGWRRGQRASIGGIKGKFNAEGTAEDRGRRPLLSIKHVGRFRCAIQLSSFC
jgi:hypothetical protein